MMSQVLRKDFDKKEFLENHDDMYTQYRFIQNIHHISVYLILMNLSGGNVIVPDSSTECVKSLLLLYATHDSPYFHLHNRNLQVYQSQSNRGG